MSGDNGPPPPPWVNIWAGCGSDGPVAPLAAGLGHTAGPPPDPLVQALIPADGGDADVVVLYGHLWDGEVGGTRRTRLYLTWLLDEYVDLTGVLIKYWRKIPFDGGTMVWVGRGQSLPRVTVPQTKTSQASFLAGNIAATYLSGAPAEALWGSGAEDAVPESVACGYTRPFGC
jgi:hypothetical protein